MLPGLSVTIEGDARPLQSAVVDAERSLGGLQRHTESVQRGLRRASEVTATWGRRLSILSGAISGAAAGAFMLARGTARTADEIAKAARASGVAGEALQELRFALGQAAGTGEAETSAMLLQLTRRMGEAADGNDTLIAAFEGLGISQDQIASGAATTEDAFSALIAAMQAAPTDAEAARLGMEMLGRQGAAIGPQLRASGADIDALRARARELGIVMSEDTLQAGEQFGDQLDELTRQFGAMKDRIGVALIPVMLQFMHVAQDRIIPAVEAMIDHVGRAIEWFSNLPAPIQEAAAVIGTVLGVGGPVLLAISVVSRALIGLIAATGPIGLFIAAAGLIYAAWQLWGDQITAAIGTALDWVSEKFTALKDFLAENMNTVIRILTGPLAPFIILWREFGDEMVMVAQFAIEWLRNGFEELMTWFSSLPERFIEFGRNIITGLWNGLRMAWDEFDLLGTVSGWASSIASNFAERLGIRSPSRVFHEFGQNIAQGLANGISASTGLVSSAMGAVTSSLSQSMGSMLSDTMGALGQLFKGSKAFAIGQAIINTWQGITEALKLPFPANLLAGVKVAAQGAAAINGIKSAQPGRGTAPRMGAVSMGSGGGGGGGGGNAAPAAAPSQFMTVQLMGDSVGRGGLDQLFAQINAGLDKGHRLKGIRLA